MICFETEYMKINRTLLLIIGMWPYQQSKLAQLQIILCNGALISIIIFQFTTFLTTENTLVFVIDVLSETLFFLLHLMYYNMFYFNNHVVRHTLEQIQHVYNELKNENEIAIIENYGYEGKRYTIVLTFIGICPIVIFLVQPWCPQIFNVSLLVNISQPHPPAYITTEYFVDEEKYFYLILLHANVVFILGLIIEIAIGTMFIVFNKWICGMFRIASYRIEKAMEINVAQTIDLKNDTMIYNEIIHAVNIHRKAITIIKFLMSNFEGPLFCLIICIVCCLSLNLYRIFQIVSFRRSTGELIVHCLFANFMIAIIFISNYVAQEILDHNNHVFATVYSMRWYKTPLYIQRMILFLLQKGTKTFSLKIGLFSASLEGTATLLSASLSYFTVLCSTSQ
ncbi:uncharacterized protein LOC116842067 [Odontomachus brunneus]|uniref:uncharacterized protein LOC116842067 n=1 Tax=Odontomachus brunneus TaxID=486640 RepID=UPI0013F26BBF|nr:uncharacterized protein LOC116842067 [Odontomachus brunneus]